MAIKKRVLGDGSVTYRVTWVLGGGASGTAPTQSETFTSESRAEAFHADVKACGWRWPEGWMKGEGYVKPNETKPAFSFAEVAEDHFALQAVRMGKGLKKPYTHHRDLQAYRNHLLPSFGTRPFAQIMPAHIEAWLQLQQGYGAKPKSIRNRHGLLYQVMEHGQKRMSLRPDNPCELTELPVGDNDRDLMWLQPWEWKILAACLRDDARRVAEALLQTGCRWGEISAIQLADCQILGPDDIVITIRQAWSKRAPDDPAPIREALHENRSWKLGRPKNGKSRRVHLTGDLAVEIMEQDITGKHPADFLFTTRSGKPWRYPDFEYDRWRQAVHLAQQCGMFRKATIHMLRHTAAVWSLSRGLTLHEVSHMLGHSSIQVTWDIYGGFAGDDGRMSREMAEQIKMAQHAIVPGEQLPTREQVYRPIRDRSRKAS